jgi:type VI secretion system protein
MHRLNLTIVSFQEKPCPPQTRPVERARMTIGRGADCDWPLDDPDRELSRRHCVIERIGDRYTITDVSANGVFLNGAVEPLGRNVSAPIEDGCEIAIGPYRIRAEFEPAAAAAALAPDALPPFTALASGPGLSWFAPPGAAADPLPPPPASAAWQGAAGDLFPLPNAAPEPGALAPDWSAAGPFAASEIPFAPPPVAATAGVPTADHVPAIEEYLRPPEIQAPVIPPGWNPLQPAEPPPAVVPGPRPEPQPVVENPIAVPSAASAAPISAISAPAGPARASEAVRAFLEGVGLPEQAAPPEDDLARLRRFGELFREMAAGLRDLIGARAMTKASFHLPQTAIVARDNNPFKFSVNLEQLLGALLAPGTPGYTSPLPAVREAVQDLKEHDLALIAATQAAVANLLARLSPHALQRAADDAGVLANLLPAARKAAWWDAFEQAHRRAVEGVEADLPGGFRADFAAAYEKQAGKR